MELIDGKGMPVGRAEHLPCTYSGLLATLLFRSPLPHPGVMFRRAAVLKAGNYRAPKPSEDLDLWLRLASLGVMVNLPETILKYRIHPASVTEAAKKAGNHHQLLLDRLQDNGGSLFSIPSSTFGRLLEKRHPFAIAPLSRIARSIAKLSGSSTLQVLHSPEFVESARCLTGPRDVLSKLLYFFLGRQKSTSLFSQALEKASFMPGIRHSLHWFRERRRKAVISRWISAQRRRGSTIEAIELQGNFSIQFIETGSGISLEKEVTLSFVRDKEATHPHLRIGDGVFIGKNTFISIHAPIFIGANVLIGPYCYITSCNHAFKTRALPIGLQGYTFAPVVIETGAWLGTHVIVLPGVTIGEGAIIGAGAVVTRNIPPYEIWGGSPAEFIAHRP
jgi:acetyltransferase-like isoleucine patch superfamily enzyme